MQGGPPPGAPRLGIRGIPLHDVAHVVEAERVAARGGGASATSLSVRVQSNATSHRLGGLAQQRDVFQRSLG